MAKLLMAKPFFRVQKAEKMAERCGKADLVIFSLTMTSTWVAEQKPHLQGAQAVQPWKFCR
jgi:hypothetical protein